jgi:hypothetical protein
MRLERMTCLKKCLWPNVDDRLALDPRAGVQSSDGVIEGRD